MKRLLILLSIVMACGPAWGQAGGFGNSMGDTTGFSSKTRSMGDGGGFNAGAATASVLSSGAATYSAAVLADNPVLFYKFNESATCTTITDYGSAMVNGSATNVTCGSTSFKGQTSASFNGASSVVSVASQLGLSGTSNPTTFEWWALDPVSPVGTMDTAPGSIDTLRNFPAGSVEWQGGNALSLGVPDTTNFHQYVTVFYNATGVGTAERIDLYRDGAFVATENTTATTDAQNWKNPWNIGNINSGANGWFQGNLIGFAIFAGRLSAARITAHYNAMTQ